MSLQTEISEDPAGRCAELLLESAAAGQQLVLTGGSTPRDAYQRAAAAGVDWTGATVWFGDERCVAPDDERSNYGMARDALLEPLERSGHAPAVHRMQGELGPDAGADSYERELREAGSPELDLLLLGLGPDGHIASLFPDQETLSERSRLVVGVPEAGHEPFVPRISLTLSAIAGACRVVVLVSGESKAAAVAAAFGADAVPDPHVPGSMLVPLVDHLTLLLDPAAAARL